MTSKKNDDITSTLNPYQPPKETYFPEFIAEQTHIWEMAKGYCYGGMTALGCSVAYLLQQENPATPAQLYSIAGFTLATGVIAGMLRSLKL